MSEAKILVQGSGIGPEEVRVWRSQVVKGILRVTVIVAALAVAASIYGSYVDQQFWQIPILLVAYGTVALAVFWRRATYRMQAGALLALAYLMGIYNLIVDAQTGDGFPFMMTVPFLAALLFSRRAGRIALIVATLTLVVFGGAFVAGLITVSHAVATDWVSWLSRIIVFVMLNLLLVLPQDYLFGQLVAALTRSHGLAHEQEQRVISEQKQRERLQSSVARYVDHMAEVAQGNLSARLMLDGDQASADDLLGVLGRSLNQTAASLQSMILQIRNVAGNLSSASSEILSATTQQASGASEQSAAIAQTTTTVDEVRTIAEQSVARAQEVATSAQRTVEVSLTGRRAMEESIASMQEIRTRVEGIAENILALSEQTQQIGEIIATVNDIAAQSNILALNASVEAARAGEYGKGFAVVAVEVRNLAEQSRQATAQVRTILSDIQKATNATVMATEEGTKGVEEGVRLAAQAQEAIDQLVAVIDESAQAATQMVAGGRQQAAGVEQIAVAMQSINHATVQSLDSTRQTENAARNLNDLAGSLAEVVERYRL